jgi:hypothetical protein
MRTAISLLVTSFVFGSLAVNFQGIGNSLEKEMFSTSGEQELLLSKSHPREQPTAPHRGSGRREFVEYNHG